jgi:hypothetical protein
MSLQWPSAFAFLPAQQPSPAYTATALTDITATHANTKNFFIDNLLLWLVAQFDAKVALTVQSANVISWLCL